MSSIFDLKASVEELSSANQGLARMAYEQHAPTRDVTQSNFPNGAIHFRWQTSGEKWWIPSRSYIRMRCKLSKANGTQLSVNDNIAPNMGLCANLFQSAEFRINDKTVARISDFMPQVDALETRLSKSKSYLDGLGMSVNLWDPDFAKRQSVVCSDSVYNKNVIESKVSKSDLGYDAPNTLAIEADTAVITFAFGGGDVPPDNNNVWQVGDEIWIEILGGKTEKYTVSAILSATTLELNGQKTREILAQAYNFYRVRKESKNYARKVSEFELTWCPPLSIFKIGHALPSMKAELVLNPQTSSVYKNLAIQSKGAPKIAGTDYEFSVETMYFYCNTVEGPRADDVTYLLDLDSVNCQSEQFSTTPSHFFQTNFDVSPSTYALTCAYQDTRSGNDTTLSASIFKVDNDLKTSSDEELKLSRFFINYAGQNLPQPKTLGLSMIKALASIKCY